MVDNIDLDLLKGIVICKESGEYLIDLILDKKINPALLSSFAGALSLFGAENLGKIEEISIKGLDVDMIIVHRYQLILVAILDKRFAQNGIREEAIKSLDIFYSTYQEEICKSYIDINVFEDFKQLLLIQIIDFFEKMSDMEKEKQIGDFGFFTEAIKRQREEDQIQNGTSY
ncbi:MAG: hypothetical protein ACTSR8_18130 [Promethearchaeota archaeon]